MLAPNHEHLFLWRQSQRCCRKSLFLQQQRPVGPVEPVEEAATAHHARQLRVLVVWHLAAAGLAPPDLVQVLSPTLGHPHYSPPPSTHLGKASSHLCWSFCPSFASSGPANLVNSSPACSRMNLTSCSRCPMKPASANYRLRSSSCHHAEHCSNYPPCSKEQFLPLQRPHRQLCPPFHLLQSNPRPPRPNRYHPSHRVGLHVVVYLCLAYLCLCPCLFALWTGSVCGPNCRCCSCRAPQRSNLVHAALLLQRLAQPPRRHLLSQGWLAVPPL
mmetsp:Transcript_67392/g.132946  ORF Transcript_67392/g.132946 Transcript_67392/m.132946 type:complete len:272 (+) Transcript_67392:287-1102(+)